MDGIELNFSAQAGQGQDAGSAAANRLPSTSCEIGKWEELLQQPAFCAEWDRLARGASEPNPFAERWYLVAALRALGQAESIRIAYVSEGSELIGLMPFEVARGYARLPVSFATNWSNHNAFLGTPLVRKGREREFWRFFLARLDAGTEGALFFHAEGLPVDGPVVRALEVECAAQGRRFGLVHREERALLEKGLSPADYLETHVRGKKRKELRRQHNRLGELGALAFERSDGREKLDTWISEFLHLERAGWKGGNGSALDCAKETRELFRSALFGAAEAGKLELLALRLDGRAIAMLVTFLTPPGSFSFKTAFDEEYARFSPGVLLQIENLNLLDRDSIAWCDSCAAQDHPMIDSLWAGRRTISRWSIAIGGPLRRATFAALLAAEKAKARRR